MRNFRLQVLPEDSGLRLDQYIIKNLETVLSRSRVQSLIKTHQVLINQRPTKAHYKVKQNDAVVINIPPVSPPTVTPEKIPLEIVFEDDDLLVVNKPTGMVTHPAVGNYEHTLVNALLGYGCQLSAINGSLRPGIVHRLDKDTSGLLVVAKNDFAHQKLTKQFSKHSVIRKYIALVKGRVAYDQGVIDYPLGRDTQNRQKFAVSFLKNSKEAVTRYSVLARYNATTLLELTPETGRTHQLRVHLRFLGHPILGDPKYGSAASFNRLALHATTLGFVHPRTGKLVDFQSEPPECFRTQ